MSIKAILPVLFAFLSLLCGSGCTTAYEAREQLNPSADLVQPTQTSFASLANCIGDVLVLDGNMRKVAFIREDLRDYTTTRQALSKPLSDGAEAWLVKLADDLGKEIFSVWFADRIDPELYEKNIRSGELVPIIISGGVTEFDRLSSADALLFAGSFKDVELRLGGDKAYDALTTDLLFRIGGQLSYRTHSTATAIIETKSREADIFYEDGNGNGVAGSGIVTLANGLHRTQRATFEYALISGIAKMYEIDLNRCSTLTPVVMEHAYQKSEEYKNINETVKVRRVQFFLQEEGFYTGAVDGQWGEQSLKALNQFLEANNYTATTELRKVHYTILAIRADARRNGVAPSYYPATPPDPYENVSAQQAYAG